MQLISDLGPDRDLPVPNRRDERRGAVRVPDGAAAGQADVAAEAKVRGETRATVSMERAAALTGPVILAIGNAPTALVRACQLMEEGKFSPALIIGAPVGFVNVVESKELLCSMGGEHIVAMGRKGGSNIAATICNALLYMASNNERE